MTDPRLEEHRVGVAGVPATIETVSGVTLDLREPSPLEIDVRDIGHGMAHICRFGGHCTQFYSVAEHSVFVASLVRGQTDDKDLWRAALLHDAHEAYLGDVPTPLKALLQPAYENLSRGLDEAIGQAFRFDHNLFYEPIVKEADEIAITWEGSLFMPGKAWDWTRDAVQEAGATVAPDIYGYKPEKARDRFLAAANAMGLNATVMVDA